MSIHDDPYADAESAADELRAALLRHGITLPNLGLDLGAIMIGVSAVSLGSVPAEIVRQVTELIP
ncbi:hypothetical protein P3T35_004002 [Kitasatospora sp. GP30]|uniref:hypothetical protein n=1 Tax=Kitasatospora sp. GP30 TaxID=3035084 RepID=UPI0024755E05|nr:hypothetical protein [Kitasatospora sp. GP30]MDH6141981.1 hypothetical protein [Kitasatospora sp. GP30]